MKLTRDEITLLSALALALVVGGLVKKYRTAHPAPPPAATPVFQKK